MTAPMHDRRGRPATRLARFDGANFHPVDAGTVDVRFVHVFVHGWQPGYRVQERLLATTDGVAALHAWDPRLVDATGRPLIADYLHLLQALASLGPEHAVLWYSWLDESATDADLFQAQRSRQATQINGRRLAVSLQRSFAADRRPRVHLIGHSHGSAVVTHAAISLGQAPEQVTLLDAPEDPISRAGGASDLIDVVLPRLRPGRRPGRPFVDSYASAFGRPYHRRPGLASVVDVLLVPPLILSLDPVRAINAAHLYPVEWYARSIAEAGRGVGYGWSPLRGADVAELHPWYRSPQPWRPLDLHRRMSDRVSARVSGRLPGRYSGRVSARRAAARRRPLLGLTLDLSAEVAAAAAVVSSEPGDQLVEFDLELAGCDGSERIDVELDGVPAYTCEAAFPVPGRGRYVMLADGRSGEHLLGARLTGGSAGAKVRLANIRLVNRPRSRVAYTPQRSAGALFGVGALAGSVGTLVTLVATGWTARKVLSALTRRRHRTG